MKAVILLSGGLDSATTLYAAKAEGFKAHCLIFDYGQRHKKEILQAVKIARHSGCEFKKVNITLPWKGSALLDKSIKLPEHRRIIPNNIPVTYVPSRNIIFLSFAASYAESIGAKAIFIGANAVDYSGYPDCRPAFYNAYQKALDQGLKAGVEGKRIKIHTPLIKKTKIQIIRMAARLKAPLHLTWSCYKGNKKPCGSCDSCMIRARAFARAGLPDPAL